MPDTHIHLWDSGTVDGKRKSSFESNFNYERVKLTFTTKYVLIDSEVIKRLKDYETKALKLREKLARRFVHQIITSNNVRREFTKTRSKLVGNSSLYVIRVAQYPPNFTHLTLIRLIVVISDVFVTMPVPNLTYYKENNNQNIQKVHGFMPRKSTSKGISFKDEHRSLTFNLC